MIVKEIFIEVYDITQLFIKALELHEGLILLQEKVCVLALNNIFDLFHRLLCFNIELN